MRQIYPQNSCKSHDYPNIDSRIEGDEYFYCEDSKLYEPYASKWLFPSQ